MTFGLGAFEPIFCDTTFWKFSDFAHDWYDQIDVQQQKINLFQTWKYEVDEMNNNSCRNQSLFDNFKSND